MVDPQIVALFVGAILIAGLFKFQKYLIRTRVLQQPEDGTEWEE